ncbi:MAG: chlorosome envelope protein B [Chlorobiaceae bacterium]|nr:chlorosome envelope protein B [Chlorobiaceae bacterium]NTV61672.1 chlorosome envelope protein B [Chlorobiaceae bacterium]
MSDGLKIDVSGTVNSLLEAAGNIAKLPLDLLNNGVKTAVSVIEPATRTAADLALTILNTLSQVLQNIASVIAPKN